MVHLLSNRSFEGFDVIRELARARALLVLAYEGVLVPLEPGEDAQIGAHTRALLRAAALLYPCAVVTSASPGILASQVARVPSLSVLGEARVDRASAVERLAAAFPPWPVAYIGSTYDDEPVFRSKVVTHPIRVGAVATSAARYFVHDREDLDRLLSALVTERARIAGLGASWQQLQRRAGGGA